MIHGMLTKETGGRTTWHSWRAGQRAASPARRTARSFKPGVWLLEDRRLLSVSIIDIGNPPGTSGFSPTAINDNDQVIGAVANGDPYLYSGGTWTQYQFQTLGPYGFVALNNSAEATGYFDFNPTSSTFGLRYSDGMGSALTPSGLYYGGSNSYAINNSGASVGEAYGFPIDPTTFQINGPFEQHATVWEPGQQIVNATYLPIPGYSIAYGINDSGQVVGAYGGGTVIHNTPFLFQDGSLTNLPELPNVTGEMPVAINNNGWIVGTAGGMGVLWRPDPTTGSYTVSSLDFYPVGINNDNIVAGSNGTSWSLQTGDVDVNSLLPPNSGWYIDTVVGINNHNDLTGMGSQGAYLLTGVNIEPRTISPNSLAWDPQQGGVDFGYQVTGAAITQDTQEALYWSPTQTYDPSTATLIPGATQTIPAGTQPGTYGPFNASAATLGQPPQGTMYLLAVTDPNNIISPADPSKVASLAIPDVEPSSLVWHPSTQAEWAGPIDGDTESGGNAGGVDLGYTISGADLPQGVPIQLFWGNANTIIPDQTPITVGDNGNTLVTQTAADVASYTIHIPASSLGTPPAGTNDLIAVINPPGTPNPQGNIIITQQNSSTATLGASPDEILNNSVFIATVGNDIQAEFMPASGLTSEPAVTDSLGSAGPAEGSLTIDQAAAICGVSGFNWVQTMNLPTLWSAYTVSLPNTNYQIGTINGAVYELPNIKYQPGTQELLTYDNSNIFVNYPNVNQVQVPNFWIPDPLLEDPSDPQQTLSFLAFFNESGQMGNVPLPNGDPSQLWAPPDNLKYYYNLGNDLNSRIESNGSTLFFEDAPGMGQSMYAAGESTLFLTQLAGVDTVSGPQIYFDDNTNFSWTSDAVVAGNVSYMRVDNPNSEPPLISGGILGVQYGDPQVNNPPVLSPIPNQTISAGSPLTLTTWAVDSDPGRILTYSLAAGAPSGAAIDPNTGVFSWTPTAAGTFSITVVVSDNGTPPLSDSQTFSVVVSSAQQTPIISWNPSSPITYGSALGATQLDATATVNGVPVSGTFAYTPDAGTVLQAGLGQPLSVMFTPDDTVDYTATGSTTLDVLKATPTINVTGADVTYDGNAHPANASITGVDGDDLSGLLTLSYVPSFGSDSAPVQAGTYTATASFDGDSDYNPASASATVQIAQATPTITWPNRANIIYGTPLGAAQFDATAGVPGTLTYTPATGTVLSAGNNQTLSVLFTPTDTKDYSTASATTKVNVDQATPTITWPNPVNITYGTALANSQLSGTASWVFGGNSITVAGTFTYTSAAGSVLGAGNGQSEAVTFTPSDITDYTTASSTATVNVAQAVTRTIVTSSANPAVYGQQVTFTATLTNTSGTGLIPTGSVQFVVDGTNFAAAVPLDATGHAVSPAVSFVAGASHTVHAAYIPSTNFVGSNNSLTQVVQAVAVEPDPSNSTLADLFIGSTGANSNDQIQVNPVGSSNTGSTGVKVQTSLNGINTQTTYSQPFTNIYAFLQGGNDNVQLANTLTINAIVTAGNGNDSVTLGNGNNTVTLGNGNDNIQGGSGSNTVLAGNGNDNVQLGDGNNNVTVGNGNDNAQFGNGSDVIVEGNGNDNVSAGNGPDLVVGGLGQHTIQLGNGNDILIDGSATVVDSGDSLRQILSDWNANSSASVDTRLKVVYNTTHPDFLKAGSGRDWWFYIYSKDVTNKKSSDRLN